MCYDELISICGKQPTDEQIATMIVFFITHFKTPIDPSIAQILNLPLNSLDHQDYFDYCYIDLSQAFGKLRRHLAPRELKIMPLLMQDDMVLASTDQLEFLAMIMCDMNMMDDFIAKLCCEMWQNPLAQLSIIFMNILSPKILNLRSYTSLTFNCDPKINSIWYLHYFYFLN